MFGGQSERNEDTNAIADSQPLEEISETIN